MKVLFILHFPPPVHGAAIVGSIIKDSRIINDRFDCRYVNLGISGSIDEIEKKSPRKLYRYFKVLVKTLRFLIFFRPDLCYITPVSKGPGFYKDSPVLILVKLFCRKVVYHFHNKGVILRQYKTLDNLLYRIVFRNTFVILLSKLLYSDIQKYVPRDKVFYCSNGIPPLLNNMELRVSSEVANSNIKEHGIKLNSGYLNKNKPGNREKSVKILFLSNLIRSKGILTLLEACSILKSRNLVFHCTITGDNGDMKTNDLQKMITKEGLDNIITVTGPQYGEEKMRLMSTSEILVHPTQNDCLPLVLLEAMQHSLPVVSTHEGAIPDVVEDNVSGFLVSRNNPVALADKLEQLIINKDLRERMGRAGFARYEKEFTQKIFENNLAAILEEIIKCK